MKRFTILVVALLVLAAPFGAFAVTTAITQDADDVAKDLPRIEFYDQINDAVSALTTGDVPKLVTAVNEIVVYSSWDGADVITLFSDGGTTNKGDVIWRNSSVATNADDSSVLTHSLFSMNNDSSETLDWAIIQAKVIDNTTNTEDSTVYHKILVGGAETIALQLDSDGATAQKLIANHATLAGLYITGGWTNGGAYAIKGTATLGNLIVQTNSDLSGTLDVDGAIGSAGSLTALDGSVTNDWVVGDHLTVTGGSLFTAGVTNQDGLAVEGTAAFDNVTVQTNVDVSGKLDVDGAVGSAGIISASSFVASNNVTFGLGVSITVTNEQVLNISTGTIHRFAASGGASGTSNACIIANATGDGQFKVIINSSANTNGLFFAQANSWAGPVLLLDVGEAASLVSVGTNWYDLGQ